MSHLFLFTTTPVQDFISQSRKLKDLYGSSQILSSLTEIGLRICKREGAKEIFPFLQQNGGSYANRFMVEFQGKSHEDIAAIAKEIEKSLLNYLKSLDDKNHHLIQKHITGFFTFFWTISRLEEGAYKKAFDNVEKSLAGAKNTRFFTQLGDGAGEQGRKCSICGERNVAVFNGRVPMMQEQFQNDKPVKDPIAAGGEGLCGVCYLKRKNAKRYRFESTADVALMHIFEILKREDYYKGLRSDAQLFFEENLNENYFKTQEYKIAELPAYKKAFEHFRFDLKQAGLKQTSYYAVIMFDGDDMGEWLSGQYVEDKRLQEFHRFLSQRLLDFATEVKKIDKIVTVYAGGEDFMGFVNVNYLFEDLKTLREIWNDKVSEPLKKEFGITKDLTFSAGVAVAHYKTPLNEVLKSVREAEKRAKDAPGKDSICFRVLKRSGEIREAVLKYGKLNNLPKITQMIKADFSDGFIATLEREFELFDAQSFMIEAELKRLLKRAKLHENANSQRLYENIVELYEEDFGQFMQTLQILKFLIREMQ